VCARGAASDVQPGCPRPPYRAAVVGFTYSRQQSDGGPTHGDGKGRLATEGDETSLIPLCLSRTGKACGKPPCESDFAPIRGRDSRPKQLRTPSTLSLPPRLMVTDPHAARVGRYQRPTTKPRINSSLSMTNREFVGRFGSVAARDRCPSFVACYSANAFLRGRRMRLERPRRTRSDVENVSVLESFARSRVGTTHTTA